jgi:hypothetical protein
MQIFIVFQIYIESNKKYYKKSIHMMDLLIFDKYIHDIIDNKIKIYMI